MADDKTRAEQPQSVGSELLEVDFAQLVGGMGQGIANAQLRLDMVSMQLAQMMSGQDYKLLKLDENGGFVFKDDKPVTIDMPAVRIDFGGEELSLLELGFTPTFYQFVDTIIEVKVSINIAREVARGAAAAWTSIPTCQLGGNLVTGFSAGLKVATVSASFAAKYQYSAEGSSLLRTKLVPVPPPTILQERMRRLAGTQPDKINRLSRAPCSIAKPPGRRDVPDLAGPARRGRGRRLYQRARPAPS